MFIIPLYCIRTSVCLHPHNPLTIPSGSQYILQFKSLRKRTIPDLSSQRVCVRKYQSQRYQWVRPVSTSASKKSSKLIGVVKTTYESGASVGNIHDACDMTLHGSAAEQEVDLVVVVSC